MGWSLAYNDAVTGRPEGDLTGVYNGARIKWGLDRGWGFEMDVITQFWELDVNSAVAITALDADEFCNAKSSFTVPNLRND